MNGSGNNCTGNNSFPVTELKGGIRPSNETNGNAKNGNTPTEIMKNTNPSAK